MQFIDDIQKAYIVAVANNIVSVTGVPVICCGQKMNEIIAGSVDAAKEKHLPVFECVYAIH